MAVIAQIGLEIRAPGGSGTEVLEAIRKAHEAEVLAELAGELVDEAGRREALETLQTFLDEAEVSDDGGAVMRYFTPHWRLGTSADIAVEVALDALERLFSEARGFSGTWRLLLDEDCHKDCRYWGADERVANALSYDFVLLPAWTRFGIHVDQYDLYRLFQEEGSTASLSDHDIQRLSGALAPKLKDLIRATALEFGMVRDHVEASG